MNTLYLGDCLFVLRDSVADESVDLVYIDPPFNSKRDYNIFFDDKEIHSQRVAFEDTWTLRNIQDSLTDLHTMKTENLYELLQTYQKVAPHAFPYLVMMSLRIVELYRVLKPTGSFYLHCDPTMSHYLKTVCDVIFGDQYFRNEIIWCYRKWSIAQKQFTSNHDVILFYSKTLNNHFQTLYVPLSSGTIRRWKGKKQRAVFDADGARVATNEESDSLGSPMPDWWEVSIINPAAKERLGYPTQKPKSLLERIVKASSNEGDVVLDAFCGCGTTIDAAEGLHRKWIGIDVSPVAISLIKRRLKKSYEGSLAEFEVRGIPTDEESARELWEQNPFAFQDWWISEFEVFSSTFGTKGADKGVDGIGLYATDNKGGTVRAAFQVKGGEKVQSKDIDALLGAMSKHKCELGVFLTSTNPTKPMLDTVAKSGFLKVPGYEFPKLQILTLKQFFNGHRPKLPGVNITFKAAEHTGKKKSEQIELL